MNFLREDIFTKKNLIYLLIMAIMILAIPLAVRFVQNQQSTQLQSQATGDEITFPGLTKKDADQNPVAETREFKIKLNSPYGPPK